MHVACEASPVAAGSKDDVQKTEDVDKTELKVACMAVTHSVCMCMPASVSPVPVHVQCCILFQGQGCMVVQPGSVLCTLHAD